MFEGGGEDLPRDPKPPAIPYAGWSADVRRWAQSKFDDIFERARELKSLTPETSRQHHRRIEAEVENMLTYLTDLIEDQTVQRLLQLRAEVDHRFSVIRNTFLLFPEKDKAAADFVAELSVLIGNNNRVVDDPAFQGDVAYPRVDR